MDSSHKTWYIYHQLLFIGSHDIPGSTCSLCIYLGTNGLDPMFLRCIVEVYWGIRYVFPRDRVSKLR